MNTHSHPPNDAPDASVSTVTTNSTPRSIKKTHVAKSKKHRKAVTAASTSARCNWKLRSYSKSKLKFPDYSFMAANTFLILSQGLKYEKFADDVQKANTLFVGQSQMDGLWRKRIRREFARWECVKGVEEWAMLGEALKQIKGYAGYDPKKYWSFQTLMNGFQSMLVTPSTEENNHEQSQDEIVSSGLNTERRAKKEKIRLVARRSIEYRPAMDLQHRPKSVQK